MSDDELPEGVQEIPEAKAEGVYKAIEQVLVAATDLIIETEKRAKEQAQGIPEVRLEAGFKMETGPLAGRFFHIDISMEPPEGEVEAWIEKQLYTIAGGKDN